MKLKPIKKPKFPPRYKRCTEFPKRTKWNPEKPISAVDNVYPPKLWPIKEGAAVFYVIGGEILSGRMRWYHPARDIDHSCCISPGHPLATVRCGGDGSACMSADLVFPYTKAGWKNALAKLSVIKSLSAMHHLKELQCCTETMMKLNDESLAILKQARKA